MERRTTKAPTRSFEQLELFNTELPDEGQEFERAINSPSELTIEPGIESKAERQTAILLGKDGAKEVPCRSRSVKVSKEAKNASRQSAKLKG